MKKIFKILSVIILIPVVLVVAALSFLHFADLNKYKPEIEKLAEKYAGINLKIGGDLDVGISLKPSIELNDVTVSQSADNKKIAHISTALIQFSILPLLHKEIVVDTVQTDNTEIFYGENDSAMINNLDFGMQSYDSPINISFDTTVANVDIDGKATVSSYKEINASNYNNINLQTTINAMGYSLQFDGALNDLQQNIKVLGNYGLIYKNNKVGGTVDFQMTDTIPFIKLNADSENISVEDFTSQKVAVNSWFIATANATEYIPNTEIPYEYLQMVNADITLDVKKIVIEPDMVIKNVKGNATLQDGVFKADITNVNFDNNDINGHVELTSPKSLPYIKLNIKGDGFDLTKYQKTQKKTQEKAGFEWLINNAYANEFMPNTNIPYQYLRMADADVALNLKKLRINEDLLLSNISAAATLKKGVFKTDVKNITAGDGTIKGSFNINANNKTASLDMVGSGIILQKLYTAFASDNEEFYIKQGGNTAFDVNINTSGADSDQYLNNLSGSMIAYLDPSVLKIKSLERLQGNIIVQILDNLKLNLTGSNLDLKCAVVRGDINNGSINFPKGIVFDSKEFYLVADGKINLYNEKINLSLQPFSGRITDVNISSILGNLIKLTGTISQPKIGINQTETAKNVVAAIASGGMYNVGDLMLSADAAPCHTALQNTAYANHFKADKSVSGSVSKGYTNTKDSIKNVGKNIKNQAKDIKNQIKGLFGK